MAALIKEAYHSYIYVFDELTDPRTKDWFLVAHPLQGLSILGLYLMFVLKWGPKWMKDKPPFKLERVMLIYNLIQIFGSAYLFIMAFWFAWGWNYRWVCEPVDYSNNKDALKVARCVYYYYLVKIIDLLDTVFFVLRKKNNQISFLHVYHHTGMVLLSWGATTYFPGGHGTMVGFVNCLVHVVMYSYYLLTVANPVYKKSIWWKKYITQIQILQFLWLVIHFIWLTLTPNCEYPRWVAAVFLPQNIFMLILFSDFYWKTYLKKPKAPVDEKLLFMDSKLEKKNGRVQNIINDNKLSEETNTETNKVNGTIKPYSKYDTKSVKLE